MRSERALIVLLTVLLGAASLISMVGCILAPLTLTEGAHLTCGSDDECPTGMFCADAVGQCSARGACIVDGTEEPVGNGTACGDGRHCVDGSCVEPSCGDGVVTFPQEQCDPRNDPDCSPTCAVPFCGDGVVDAPETCDDTSSTCVSCLFACTDLGNIRADCDLSGDECECEPKTIDSLGFLVTAGVMLDDRVVYTVTQSGLDDNDVVVVDGQEQQTLFEGLEFAHVARHGGEVLLAHGDFDASVIEAILPEQRTVASFSRLVFQLTSDGTTLVATTPDGLFVVDAQSGEQRLLARVCDRFLPTPTIFCDGAVVCLDDEGAVVRVDVDSGDTSIVGPVDGDVLPFCAGGDIFWHDTRTVFRAGDDGAPQVVTTIFQRSGQVRPQFYSYVRGQRMLLSMASDDIAESVTFSYDLSTAEFSVPIAGGILDVLGDDVLAFGFRERKLLRVTLAGAP
jgi:hypothetical protein